MYFNVPETISQVAFCCYQALFRALQKCKLTSACMYFEITHIYGITIDMCIKDIYCITIDMWITDIYCITMYMYFGITDNLGNYPLWVIWSDPQINSSSSSYCIIIDMWITDIYCITIDMWTTDILLCSCLQYVFDNTTEEGCDVVVSLSQNDRTLERRNNRTMTNLHIGFTIMKVQLCNINKL